MQKDINVVILAAGDGKRMHAPCSKVLCEVAGKPMVSWVIDTARKIEDAHVCVIASTEDVAEKARQCGCSVREQKERKGTGHAVMMASDLLSSRSNGYTMVLCGDAPFIDEQTIKSALEQHISGSYAVTVVTACLDDPGRYGRIVRDGEEIKGIVEYADADEQQRAIREINSGVYWFDTDKLLHALDKITSDNAQGEYYLTDTLSVLISEGCRAGAFRSANPDIVLGANDPAGLLLLNEKANAANIERHLRNGVRFASRYGITVGPDVEIEPGAEILTGCTLTGHTRIGTGAVIGPNSIVNDTSIGAGTVFESSKAVSSTVGRDCTIGPFVQLRPDSHIGNEVKIGDFVEIKNSTIGDGTSVAHLTYVGDADVGRCCNFGCGTVFVNYDGVKKNRITIGDFCFIGCNTNLIAPVTLGNGAYTAAGVTVTRDIPEGALALGDRTLVIKDGWAARKLKKYIEKQKTKHNID